MNSILNPSSLLSSNNTSNDGWLVLNEVLYLFWLFNSHKHLHGRYFYYIHFRDENWGAEILSNVHKDMQEHIEEPGFQCRWPDLTPVLWTIWVSPLRGKLGTNHKYGPQWPLGQGDWLTILKKPFISILCYKQMAESSAKINNAVDDLQTIFQVNVFGNHM